MKMLRLSLALLLAVLGGDAWAGSTVNPTVPAQNAPLSSAVVRNNFAATYSDINNILGKYAGTTAPPSPTPMQDWVNTSGGATYSFTVWNPSTATWVQWGSLNTATGVFTANVTSGSVIVNSPLTATYSAGHVTLGLAINSSLALDGSNNLGINLAHSNVFTAAQTINLNSVSIPAPLSGAGLQVGGSAGAAVRIEIDSFAGAARFSCARTDGTASIGTALQTNDEICALQAFGYNGSAVVGPQAAVRQYAAQNWSPGSAYGTYMRLGVTLNGTTTLRDALGIENDGGITAGSLIGTSTGFGTFNAGGYYVSGSLVAESATSPLVLNSTTGVISCPTCATGTGGALTNGTTTTSGYSNTQVLASNGTTLTAYSVSGTGNVALTTSPSITTPSIIFGTGATSQIQFSSTNTGFNNQLDVFNVGTASNSATVAAVDIALTGTTSANLVMSMAGGANPSGTIGTGTGTTGGLGISAQAGNISISSPNGASLLGALVVLGQPTVGATTIDLGNPSIGGGVTVNIAAAGNGLSALNVYNGAGSLQQWIPGGGNTVLTFPTVTDTLVGLAATQTLTNKTINSAILGNPEITGASPVVAGQLGWVSPNLNYFDGTAIETLAGTTNTITLTNKTINCNNNTCTNLLANLTGTGSGVNTALALAVNAAGGFPTYTAGSWSPTITTSATPGTPAYAFTPVGSYEQIGRHITARFSITLSSWAGSPTGNVQIGGLPVAASSTTNDNGACIITDYVTAGLSSAFGITGIITPGQSVATLLQNGGTAVANVTPTNFGPTGTAFGVCEYHS